MARSHRKPPSYRLHKPSGQAVVTFRAADGVRRDVYLGVYGSPESREEYARIIRGLAAGASPSVPVSPTVGVSVNELLVGFLKWAASHYRDADGIETSEVREIKRSVGPLVSLYGPTPAAEFGPRALAAVRQHMIGLGWCRSNINKRVDRFRRAFRWATAEELVPVAVYQALRAMPGLRKGRTEARESEPVLPVDPAHVAATVPFLSPHVGVMVELQKLTGMRPGEICRLTLGEVDQTGALWIYRPGKHKNTHRGKPRVIPLGPRAQAMILSFLRGSDPPPDGLTHIDPSNSTARGVAADAYEKVGRYRDADVLRDSTRPVVMVAGCAVDPSATIFSPRYSREEQFRAKRAARKSKVPPSQQDRRTAKPARQPGDSYSTCAYTAAVRKAAAKAGTQHWHPNQLRHLFATEVRKAHGLEAAQVLLGHSRADVTQVYAERDATLAARVAAEIG